MQHFNSIKVRLEPEMVAKGEKVYIFQFHKGAIRTENEVQVTEESRNFNSIKVRLELLRKVSMIPSLLFQFHKGAIRTGVLSSSS